MSFRQRKHREPQESHQIVAGYYHRLNEHGVELSAEVYYKTMNNEASFFKNNAMCVSAYIVCGHCSRIVSSETEIKYFLP